MARPKRGIPSRAARPRRKQPEMPDLRRAVIYARVSSKDQEKEGFSIPAQTRLLEDYAATHGIEVVKKFVDVETAKRAGRTNFNKMLEYLDKRGAACRIVLVEKTDRLYRNLKDWVTLDGLDLEIHLVKEGAVLCDDSRSSEKFMHGIKVLMAKNYIDNLSEEVTKGMREKARQGLWPSRAPLGYLNTRNDAGEKVITPDPERAVLVIQVFKWAASGFHSLNELAAMANAAGLTSKKGKPVQARAHIYRILRNPLYTGQFLWDGEWFDGVHEPLISITLFDEVQDALARRYAKQTHKVKHNFAFTGLIQCGVCGCMVTAQINKGKYVYYHCTKNRDCDQRKYTREEELERQFTEAVQSLRFAADDLDYVKTALRDSFVDRRQFRQESVASLRARHDQIQQQIEAMYLDKLEGRVDATFFDRLHRKWRAEQAELIRSMGEHDTADAVCVEDGIRLLEVVARIPECFSRRSASEKARLIRYLQSNSTLADGKLTVEFAEPFNIFAEIPDPENGEAPSDTGSEGASSRLVLPRGIEPLSPP